MFVMKLVSEDGITSARSLLSLGEAGSSHFHRVGRGHFWRPLSMLWSR